VVSYGAYYRILRHSGTLKKGTLNPLAPLKMAVEMWDMIVEHGRTPVGRVFLEVGTGRRINLPVAFWLCGAGRVMTVDVNPYLAEELVKEDIGFLRNNRDQVRALFGDRLDEARFGDLDRLTSGKWRLNELLDLCAIEYLARGDAAHLDLPSGSVDFQVSISVFEHIPPEVLVSIMEEGYRVVRDDGLFINVVDFSDHFSHSDKSISSIHFLRFSEEEWRKIAGNRYAYANRLRIDDLLSLMAKAGHRQLGLRCINDASLLDLVRSGRLALDPKFKDKSDDSLSATCAWVVSEKDRERAPRILRRS
jgi:hypothetical protein